MHHSGIKTRQNLLPKYQKIYYYAYIIYTSINLSLVIGVGDGGRGARAPLKFGKNWGGDNFYVKFGHFSGKNHVKLGNFVNFSGKYNKDWGILTIFRARIM